MHLTVEMARKDDITFAYRDVMKELKCCGFDVPHRTEITNEDIRFFAWLCRSAVALIEKKDAEIDRLKAELNQYHKADGFLAVHGWQWKDDGTEHHTEQLRDGEHGGIRKG